MTWDLTIYEKTPVQEEEEQLPKKITQHMSILQFCQLRISKSFKIFTFHCIWKNISAKRKKDVHSCHREVTLAIMVPWRYMLMCIYTCALKLQRFKWKSKLRFYKFSKGFNSFLSYMMRFFFLLSWMSPWFFPMIISSLNYFCLWFF